MGRTVRQGARTDAVQLAARWRRRKPATAGTRPWAKQETSFRWTVAGAAGGWASAANEALHVADAVLGELGNPVGVASYRPPHATGEDFLHNYIGNLGVPIELYPDYPANAHTILLDAGRGDRSGDHRQDRRAACAAAPT